MKYFIVTIELETVEINVKAKNKTDAKNKALARLNRRKVSNLARKHWPSNRRQIYVDERYY